MTNRLIATILAAGLALTSLTAAPARAADSGEIGRFLLGAGTLFVIGSALSNNNRNYHNRRTVTRYDSDPVVTYRRYPSTTHSHRPHYRSLPEQCERTIYGKYGPRTVYSERCLKKFGYID